MNEIKDYAGYNKAMSKSLLDKVWWLDKIPPIINTIIDFGCADGAMFAFIHKMFPNRFHFIGVDNNDEMLRQTHYKALRYGYKVQLFSSVENIPPALVENAVLVMNSVCHEILNYTTYWEGDALFSQIKNLGAKYIAIRDMYEHDNPCFTHLLPCEEINNWMKSTIATPHKDLQTGLLEYMLKADYKNNWDREVEERYLWKWGHWFWRMENYETICEEDFMLPYHRRVWRKRYHIPLADLRKIRTHKKMLLHLTK